MATSVSPEHKAASKAAEAALALIKKFVKEGPIDSILNLVSKDKESTSTAKSVTEIAQNLKQVIFKVQVNRSEAGGAREKEYSVGIPANMSPQIRFAIDPAMFEKKATIPFAFVVPVKQLTDLKRFDGLDGKPVLEFRSDQWKQLDVKDSAPPRVILTTQLSGCTFAIGIVDNSVVMGHCQPGILTGTKTLTGREVAEGVSRGAVFDGLPDGKRVGSTFFIRPGDMFADNEHLGYSEINATTIANVLGLVHRKTLFFIVAVVKGGGQTAPEKVYLVRHVVGSSSGWTTNEVT